MENPRAAATSSNIPADEDTAVTTGTAGRGPNYHIKGRVVNKEEWDQYHQNFLDQWRNEEKKEEQEKDEEKNARRNEEEMSNRHGADEEEVMGENYHHEKHCNFRFNNQMGQLL